jgi:hypothetical protein
LRARLPYTPRGPRYNRNPILQILCHHLRFPSVDAGACLRHPFVPFPLISPIQG